MSRVEEVAEAKKIIVKAINDIRKKNDLPRINKLKRGVPKYDGACPIAMSLALTGFPSATEFMRWAIVWHKPALAEAIATVVSAVDKGECPELEIPQSQIKIKKPGERKATVIFDPAVDGKLK